MSQTTNGNSRRTFGLADAMILTAATALPFSFLRVLLKQELFSEAQSRYPLSLATTVGASFVACWGIGLLAIELRSSQLRSKCWMCRPGIVACATATAASLIKLSVLLIWAASQDAFKYFGPAVILGRHLVEPAAMSVLAGWLTLWLVGSLKLERTWSDYLGIMIGISWIVLFVMFWLEMSLM